MRDVGVLRGMLDASEQQSQDVLARQQQLSDGVLLFACSCVGGHVCSLELLSAIRFEWPGANC